jgi:serine/threonine protein kinase
MALDPPRVIRMRSRDLIAPIPLTSHELMAALWESRILPGDDVRRLSAECANASVDGSAWAQTLVERGLLSAFQVEQLAAGNGERLVLGGYRLLERLGEGGMGQVFKAEHQLMQRVVALKVIAGDPFPCTARSNTSSGSVELSAVPPATPRLSDSAVQAFHREVQAAGRLQHANIIASLDAAEDRGIHFLVMEYVPGVDLGQLVRESGPLPVALACEYVRQAALGLHYAYEQGVIHRDIKPSNLLLTWEGGGTDKRATLAAGQGVVKLLDLGLARLGSRAWEEDSTSDIAERGLCGTPDFMAPEIAEDSRIVDTRADLYSLGCTLYYLLTGHTPFPGGSWTEKILRHRLDAITPPQKYRSDLPAAVVAILYRLLAKDPVQRFQVPADLAATLQTWLATEETEPWPQTALPSAATVQTPDLMGEGTWPSLEMEVASTSQPANLAQLQADVPRAHFTFLHRVAGLAFKVAICIAALSFSAVLGLALAWVVKHWEERQPAGSTSPVASISGPGQSAEHAQSNAAAPIFVVRETRFTKPAAAIEAAQDGDTIHIQGNGSIMTEPLVVHDKALTFQAAPGCRPSLRLVPAPGTHPWQALLTSNRTLTLVGLDLACPSADGRKAPREPMHLIYLQHAVLNLIDCRIAAPGVTAPIVCRNCAKVELRGCKLAAAASALCVEISDGPGCELVVENSHLATEQPDGAAVTLWAAEGKPTSPPRVTLERNTLNVGRVVAFTGLPFGPEISAHGNDLTFDQALVSCAAAGAAPDGRRFVWHGSGNTFQAAAEWLFVDGKPAGVRGLDAWRTFCGDDEPDSREK